MTHMRPMSESEGKFTNTKYNVCECRKCKGTNVKCQRWESSDGAYEDWKYVCDDCGRVWWVEGADA
jgi:hypothetical protein